MTAMKAYRLECYCSHIESIENYELAKADDFIGWDVHHRLETHTSDGIRRSVDLSKAELIALGTYYDRPASELIFLKHGDHMRLHNNGKRGRHLSEETKAKLSEAAKHRAPVSAETREKQSTSHRGKHLSEEAKAKMSTSHRGKHRSAEAIAKTSAANRGKHRSAESKAKMSAAQRARFRNRNGCHNRQPF